MMQFSGCELYSHNTRALLEGMKSVLNTIDGDEDKVGSILLLIDTLLEEEGIAEAELNAEANYNDYDDCDWPEDYDCSDYYPDPMESAEAAFDYLEEEKIESWYHDLGEYEDIDLAEMQDAEEIESWANTPHEDINTELKQIDEEIADRKAAASIKRARIAVMNKIYFENGDVYPIHDIHFEVDDNGIPVDIEISTFSEYLDDIAEKHCQLGYNQSDLEIHGFHFGLYGRLDRFGIVDYRGLIQYTFIPSKVNCVI